MCDRKIGPFDCCSVVQGDCLELMKSLPDGCVDAVITDPPYGVNLGKHDAAKEKRPQYLAKQSYVGYEDTYENFIAIVVPAVKYAVSITKRGIVFCAGINAWDLPRANTVGGVYLPAGCGRNPWGFASLAHCLMYGKAPRLELGAKATAIRSTEAGDDNDHPCPKPEGWMRWAVDLASLEGETILDPFCGSGTTLVAAKKLGRHFLGFEISEEYCRIARERLDRIDAQPNLFQSKPEQMALA